MEQTVQLRSGSRLIVRPIEPDDKATLIDALKHLGRESRYLRFLSPIGQLSERQLRYLTEVDHHDHEALVAFDHSTGAAVGVARFIRLHDADDAAEFAVTVADDWQGRGVGTALLGLLADRAREEGVARFRGYMLTHNKPMREVLRTFGEPRVLGRDGSTVEVEVDLPEVGVGQSLHAMLKATAQGEAGLRQRRAEADDP